MGKRSKSFISRECHAVENTAMGLFDFFRKQPEIDALIRKKLGEFIFHVLTDERGIHVEDAISAAATLVGERCIELAGNFPLRDHDLAPGSRVFSTRANELICGDVQGGVSQLPAGSIIGMLRSSLDRNIYPDAEFPDMGEVFKQYASRIGDPADWGKVPLSVPKEHFPNIPPLRFGYETRTRVDAIFAPVLSDKAKCLRIATECLAEILTKVAAAIDHRLALTLAIETINGMAKTAPMTERAMKAGQEKVNG